MKAAPRADAHSAMDSTAFPLLVVDDVAKRYGVMQAVDGASLTLESGKVTCLLGRSGCGKSTLLRLIAGIERPDRGTIRAGERVLTNDATHVPPEAREIGLVFQDYALFPHLDVRGNIGFGLAHLSSAERGGRVEALLDRFQIAPLADAFPHSLSGGERQRVAIARALAREPRIVLMDEPFSGLDGALRRQIQTAILGELRAGGAGVLIVTHDAGEAMRIGDRVALMAEGRILQSGTPEECYAAPATIAAARLLGPVNAIPGRICGEVIDTAIGRFPAPGLPDGLATLMARPEAFAIDYEETAFDLAVTGIAYLGDRYELSGMAGDTSIFVNLASRPAIEGGTVRCGLRKGAWRVLID